METEMSNTLADSAVLFYKEGSSDKVYQVQLEAKGSNWVVNYQYGRRGSTLTEGTKTDSPVEYEKAAKIFQAAITSKKAKGYTEDTSGKVFAMSHNEVNNTGVVPQLLNNIEESTLNTYIADPAWMMQQKFDGKRMMIRRTGNKVEAINRRGLTCGFPDAIRDSLLENTKNNFLIDGECVGEVYYAFDYLEDGCVDMRNETALDRYDALKADFGDMGPSIMVVANATSPARKRKLLEEVRSGNFEGIVLKKVNSLYKPGRPNKLGDQLKFKFVATADVIVTAVNDKRSVAMAVYPDGRKSDQSLVNIGNCTIPPNHEIPQVDDVIEVRYLYAYPNGALYQPIYLGPRTDKDARSCKVNQLKYKAGTEEEE
jgi:bifunctional non-homologous end joining protein LigD